MKAYSVLEAKTHLSRLIVRACAGEEVVIQRAGRAMVRLVPMAEAQAARKFGSMKGRARVDAGFFDALPEEELSAWEGGTRRPVRKAR